MFRILATFSIAVALSAASAFAAAPMKGGMPPLPPQPKVRPAGIPASFMMVSPCVRRMGEHWADIHSKTGLTGPIYGTYHGKPIFSEIMVTQSQLQKGFTYLDLKPLAGYSIDHVDFEFEPHGHPGMPFPHYDVHAYYISAAEEAKICPDGAPNPAMKPSM
jgi:hypothetical protein